MEPGRCQWKLLWCLFFPLPFFQASATASCHAIPRLTFLISLVEISATLTCINPY